MEVKLTTAGAGHRWLIGTELDEFMNFKLFGAIYALEMHLHSKQPLNIHHLKQAIDATCRVYPMFHACIKEEASQPIKYYFDKASREPQIAVLDVEADTGDARIMARDAYLKYLEDINRGPIQCYILFPEVQLSGCFRNTLAVMNLHCMCDGLSIRAHGQDILQNLNSICQNGYVDSSNQPFDMLPSVWELIQHLMPANESPILHYKRDEVFGSVPAGNETPKYCRQFKSEELQALRQTCRFHKTSITGLFTYLFATHLSEILAKRSQFTDQEITVEVPINLRNSCTPQVPTSYGGIYTTCGRIAVPHPSFIPSDESLIWKGARDCTNKIQEEKKAMTWQRMISDFDSDNPFFYDQKSAFRDHIMVSSIHVQDKSALDDRFVWTSWNAWCNDYSWYLLDVGLETLGNTLNVLVSGHDGILDFDDVCRYGEHVATIVNGLMQQEI